MLKLAIEGWNTHVEVPKGWNPGTPSGDRELHVRMTNIGMPKMFSETAWQPTADELAALNAGGHIVLKVTGVQVPVDLYVQPKKGA